MHKLLVVTLLVLATVPLAAPPADANHCGPIIIFGRVAQVAGQNGGVNLGGVGCIALQEGAPDLREITPGSPNLQVRFIGDLGESELTGTLVGLGLDASITLVFGAGTYNSAYIPIDPLATGDVTATVDTPDGAVSVTFHKSA